VTWTVFAPVDTPVTIHIWTKLTVGDDVCPLAEIRPRLATEPLVHVADMLNPEPATSHCAAMMMMPLVTPAPTVCVQLMTLVALVNVPPPPEGPTAS